MITEPTPLYDKLTAQKETVLLGLAAAQQCGAMERAALYQRCLDEVERRIGALTRPLYAGTQRAALRALARAYQAKQVTPAEYGRRAAWLRAH